MSHQRCSIEQLPNATRVGKTIEVQDNTRVLPCLEAHLMEVCSNCLLKRVCLPEFDNQMDKTVVTRYRVDI